MIKFRNHILAFCLLFSCRSESPLNPVLVPEINFYRLIVQFHTLAGSEKFEFGKEYLNQTGEKFVVSRFQYYLSNFSLQNDNGQTIEIPDSYFLITANRKDSLILQNIPKGNYKSLSFLIGVDSVKSKSGDRNGDLDPTHDMFIESSGHTSLALEGKYNASEEQGDFKYLIKGYSSSGFYSVQKVVQDFNQPLVIFSNKKIVFNNDVKEIFMNPISISIASKPIIDAAGKEAMMVSANYKDMFSLKSIE